MRISLTIVIMLVAALSGSGVALGVVSQAGDDGSAEAQYSPPGQTTPPLEPLGKEVDKPIRSRADKPRPKAPAAPAASAPSATTAPAPATGSAPAAQDGDEADKPAKRRAKRRRAQAKATPEARSEATPEATPDEAAVAAETQRSRQAGFAGDQDDSIGLLGWLAPSVLAVALGLLGFSMVRRRRGAS